MLLRHQRLALISGALPVRSDRSLRTQYSMVDLLHHGLTRRLQRVTLVDHELGNSSRAH